MVFIGARPALEPRASHGALAYALSKSLLFRLAESINARKPSAGVTAAVLVPGTIDTPQNRDAMPGADVSTWVSPEELADMAWILVSGRFPSLREPVVKMYGGG